MPTTDDASPVATALEAAHAAHLDQRIDEAIVHYRTALADGVDLARVYNDLGIALMDKRQIAAAIVCYRNALAIEPDAPEVLSNLGNALRAAARLEEAVVMLERAATLDPDDNEIALNAGGACRDYGQLDAALGHMERARALAPDDAKIAFEHAFTLLLIGRWREGFVAYEQRFDFGGLQRRKTAAPLWQGEPLGDRDLLIVAEQGHGDMIQFVRLVPRLAALTTGHVQLECHPALLRLFQASLPQAIAVIPIGETPRRHNAHAPLMSLPHLLDVDIVAPEPTGPYLTAPSTGRFDDLLADGDGRPKVGLTWAGSKIPKDRSCPFPAFLGLLEIPGVAFYSLQRGEEAGDIAAHGAEGLVRDLTPGLADFADDAEVLERLDLVISIDTAMCHLAAAVGKEVWTLLTYAPDWRFGAAGETCPWHPSMRLFRQDEPGDWRPVIAAAREALGSWAEDWRRRHA